MKSIKLTEYELGIIELAAGRYPATEVARWLGRGHNTILRQMQCLPNYRPVKWVKQNRYPWLCMEVGDSHVVDYATNRRVRDAAVQANRRYCRQGRRYTTVLMTQGRTLIRRVA